jgi:RNA polymerase sigma-70 factor, ECF subfamily
MNGPEDVAHSERTIMKHAEDTGEPSGGLATGYGCVNDRDLIERCRAGERCAQRQLFELTSVRVYRVLLRMTGNPEDASDLTQETFVKGLQRLHQFDGRSAVTSWFYRIAVNEALQFRRRQSVGTAKLQVLAPDRPNEARQPATDLRLDLEGALAELPPDDQALLLLRYQEELDYRGIADVLECAEGTVASRLNRARDRLREVLRKSYG